MKKLFFTSLFLMNFVTGVMASSQSGNEENWMEYLQDLRLHPQQPEEEKQVFSQESIIGTAQAILADPYEWKKRETFISLLNENFEQATSWIREALFETNQLSYEEGCFLGAWFANDSSLEIKEFFGGVLIELAEKFPRILLLEEKGEMMCGMPLLEQMAEENKRLVLDICKEAITSSLSQDFDFQEHLKLSQKFKSFFYSGMDEELENDKSSFSLLHYLTLKQKITSTDRESDYFLEDILSCMMDCVPHILSDESFTFDQRLTFANAYFNKNKRSKNSKVVDFYSGIVKGNDLELQKRLNVAKRLSIFSQEDFVELVHALIQEEEGNILFKGELAYLANKFGEGKGTFDLFLGHHQASFAELMREHQRALPVLSKTGVSSIHDRGALGAGKKIAICDLGFFKAVPGIMQGHQNLSDKHSDIYTYSWNQTGLAENVLPMMVFGGGSDTIESLRLPYHGSEMLSYAQTMAPEAQILPVAVKDDLKSWVQCLNALAESDVDVDVVSMSRGLLGEGNLGEDNFHIIHPELKGAIYNCLRNGKVVVLCSGNDGAVIPAVPEVPDYSGVICEMMFDTTPYDIKASPSQISSLFQGDGDGVLSNFLLAGSTQSGSLNIHDSSVRPGTGVVNQHYLTVDADNIHSFFHQRKGWGGTSASTALNAGMIASLWSIAPELPGSTILNAMLTTGSRGESYDPTSQGMGNVNPGAALDKILTD